MSSNKITNSMVSQYIEEIKKVADHLNNIKKISVEEMSKAKAESDEMIDEKINEWLSKPFRNMFLTALLGSLPKEKISKSWELIDEKDLVGFVDQTEEINDWWNTEKIEDGWETIESDKQLTCSYIDDIACQYAFIHEHFITDSPNEIVKTTAEKLYLVLKYWNII